MAMWFRHLYYVERSSQISELDVVELMWGSLYADSDKLSSLTRQQTHLAPLSRPILISDFIEILEIDKQTFINNKAFLAGYLSHIAVDTAWYQYLREFRSTLFETWSASTTRAANFMLDVEIRPLVTTSWDMIKGAKGETILPKDFQAAASIMRMAASTYLQWSGSLSETTLNPITRGMLEQLQGNIAEEKAIVNHALSILDRNDLDQHVQTAVDKAISDLVSFSPE